MDFVLIPLMSKYSEVVGYTKVSPEDAEWASSRVWRILPSGSGHQYAGYQRRINGRCVRVPMHRLLLGLTQDDPRMGDHRNGDTFDNRRSNLRIATSAQNAQNKSLSALSSSGIRGVWFDKSRNRWVAEVKVDGRKRMRYFREMQDAATCAREMQIATMPFYVDRSQAE